jgi:hypothetical protein
MSSHDSAALGPTAGSSTAGGAPSGRDWFLIGLVLVVFCIGLYGIHWGRVECWNTDNMALRSPFHESGSGYYLQKPPFHTYTNFFLVRAPLILVQKALHLSDSTQLALELIASRVLILIMYVVTVLLFYRILCQSHGQFAARVLTALLGTGAGMFVEAPFLTADIPVLFWMSMSFYFAYRILYQSQLRYYLLAGLFAGLATATKYNGLAVALAIPLAHLLATGYTSARDWRNALTAPRVYAGILIVPIAFVLGNPHVVLNHDKFIADFVYNYQVIPIYDGRVEGHSYLIYFERFGELIGLPALVFVIISVAASLAFRRRPQGIDLALHTRLLALFLFLIYYLKFAGLPLLPARFVMPSLPWFMILAAPALAVAPQRAITLLLAPIIAYSMICSIYVGQRLIDDPRMLAQDWVVKNVTGGRTIESHIFVPQWSRLPGADLKEVRLPYVSGRNRLFAQLLPADSFAKQHLDSYEKDGESLDWYTRAALLKRRPDFIAINRSYYGTFFAPPVEALYPEMRRYFDDLLHERVPYRIVFHAETPKYPEWIYPRDIFWLNQSLTIFERDDQRPDGETTDATGTTRFQ